ncbi:MAG TPA: type II CAAX endopeptidase family protein [Terriglobia bacterium]|nr:type II CAAX endopeptidase family protein [Terriglobia bacterium]
MRRPLFEHGIFLIPKVQGFAVYSALWLVSLLATSITQSRQGLLIPVSLQLMVVAGFPLAFSWAQRLTALSIFKSKGFSWRNALLSGLASLCLIFLLDEIEVLQSYVIPETMEVGRQTQALVKAASTSHLFGLLISLALVPSLCEEFCFRGFLFDRFLQDGSISQSILITSAMFGFFHQDPSRFLVAAVAGCVLATLVVRTGSLYPAIVTHFGVNAGGILLLNNPLRNFVPWTEGNQQVPAWLVVLSLLGISAVFKGLKKEEGFRQNPSLEGKSEQSRT